MAIKSYKSTTNGRRGMTTLDNRTWYDYFR